MKHTNPFIGNNTDYSSSELPVELQSRLNELDDDFETVIYTKPKEVKRKKENPFLVIRGGLPPCISIVKKSIVIEDHKKEWENHKKKSSKIVENTTTDVIKVSNKVKNEFIRSLDKNYKEMSDFFLKEISPIESAFETAISNVLQTLELITDSEVDDSHTLEFRTMLADTIKMKTLNYFMKMTDLNAEQQTVLINKFFNRPKITLGERK